MHRQRQAWAEAYTHLLQDLDEVVLPRPQPNRIHSWHLYVVRLRLDRLKIDRAQFIAELQQRDADKELRLRTVEAARTRLETLAWLAFGGGAMSLINVLMTVSRNHP